mgnify:CR=1 FL=1
MKILLSSLFSPKSDGFNIYIFLPLQTIFYIIIWLLSQDKLIYTDEVVFATDFVRVALGQWSSMEIPHPPLYVILGGVSTQLFGHNLPAMRLVGGIGYLLTLWLIPLSCRCLIADPARARRASLLATFAWAIHPLALQGSLLLDIDNTIFPPTLLLFALALLLTESTSVWQRVIYVGLTFAMMLWVKLLPSTFLFAIIVVVIYVIRRRFVFSTLGALVLGLLIFVVSLLIFSLITGFPLEVVLGTFLRTQNAAQSPGRLLSRLIMGGGITAVWIGIPLLVIFGHIVFKRFMDILRNRQLHIQDLLILYVIVGFIIFTIGNELPMGFPRYHYPLALILVIVACAELARREELFHRSKIIAAFILSLCCIMYFAIFVPDPLLPHYELTFETKDLMTRLMFGLRSQVTALLIPLGASLVLYRVMTRKWAIVPPLVSFCAATWLVTTITQTHAEYSTIYEYGRTGGWKVAELIQQRTQLDERIVAPKEILWAAQREGDFVVQLLVCPQCTAQSMINHFSTTKPSVYVLTTKEDKRYTYITRDPQFVDMLKQCYDRPIVEGNYIVYFRNKSICN